MLVALAMVGLLTSGLVARTLQLRERRLFELELEHRAHDRGRAIERELRAVLADVESIAGLYAASNRVEPGEFATFTAAILEKRPALKALSFNAIVPAAQRIAHELANRREGHPAYRITERAADHRLVPAAERESYVPVTLIEPLEGNAAALGYDIASEPERRHALLRVRDMGRAAITGRLALVQDTPESWGVLICVPIPARDAGGAWGGPWPGLQGFAVGVVRIQDLVNQSLSSLEPSGIDLRLMDESASGSSRWLYFHRSRTLGSTRADEIPESGSDAAAKRIAYGFEIAGRSWSVVASPTPAYLASYASWGPSALFATGLLLTAMLVGYLALQASVNRRLRQAASERRRAEEREAGFGRMLDGSHDEIYVFALDSLRFLHVNRGALENVGYSMHELKRMTPLDLKPEITPESFAELLRPLREGKREKITFTTIHRRKDGSVYDVEVHLQLSGFDGVPAFAAVIMDITERKRFEERLRQSQRIEALGTLAGGIAHDFNNLLTAIIGYTELSRAEARTGQIHANLTEVIRASERARGLVGRILTFSKRSPVERRPVDLCEIIEEALHLVRVSAPADVVIREVLRSTGEVVGDPTQIHQIIMNLCTNAVHAMSEHGGTLEVELGPVELVEREAEALGDFAPGEYARISVRDEGPGIPPDVLDRIFDPFFTTKKEGEGSGMGLSVVYGIVRGHGGALSVETEPGRGTTFAIHLPLARAAAACEPHTGGLERGRSESLLLVDDEPSVNRVLARMLQHSGFRVEAFTDSSEALERLRAHVEEYDLVITDYNMPGLNGTKLARELTLLAPTLPVILLSGYGDLLEENEVKASGVREVVSKPIRTQELVAVIRRVLDAARNEPRRDAE